VRFANYTLQHIFKGLRRTNHDEATHDLFLSTCNVPIAKAKSQSIEKESQTVIVEN